MSVLRMAVSQKRRDQVNIWLGSVLTVLLLAVLEYAGLLTSLRGGIEQTIQPFLKGGAQVIRTVRLPIEWARVATRKYTYVLDLELRYAESAAQLSELDRLRKENESLRQLLEGEQASLSAQLPQRRLASVLSYAQPTISLGTADSIHEGALVFVGGTVVGRVTQTSVHESQVKLLPAFGQADVLLVQTEAGVSGLLLGENGEIVLTEIPIDAAIQVGQRVETSGQVGVLPHLYVGRISAVHREEGAPTQTAVIDQGISFYRTSIVEVVP